MARRSARREITGPGCRDTAVDYRMTEMRFRPLTLAMAVATLMCGLVAGGAPSQQTSRYSLGGVDRAGFPLLLVGARRGARRAGLANEKPDAARAHPEPRQRALGRVRHRPAARRSDVARERRHAQGAGARVVSRARSQDAGRTGATRAGRQDLDRQRHLPGWQTGERPSLDDPREPAPTVAEVGRGPVSEQIGRFNAVRLVRGGVVLEYTVRGAEVREWMSVGHGSGRSAIVRNIRVGPATEPLWLVLGFKTVDGTLSACRGTGVAPVLESLSLASRWRRGRASPRCGRSK